MNQTQKLIVLITAGAAGVVLLGFGAVALYNHTPASPPNGGFKRIGRWDDVQNHKTYSKAEVEAITKRQREEADHFWNPNE